MYVPASPEGVGRKNLAAPPGGEGLCELAVWLVWLGWLVLIIIISAGLGHPPTPLALPPSLPIGLRLLYLSTATVINMVYIYIYIILDLLLFLSYNYIYNYNYNSNQLFCWVSWFSSNHLFSLLGDGGLSPLLSI